MSKDEKPKQSGRKKEKYPALKKKFNLKRRSEFIETDYIKGVYDADGNEISRPLNDTELEWLNKFNEETINANFVYNAELNSKRKELKQVQLKLAEISPKLTKRIYELDKLEKRLESEVTSLREEHLLYSDPQVHREIYKEDYANKMCILSDRKSKGLLDEHTDTLYDKMYEKIAEHKDEAQVNDYHEKDMADRGIDDY